MLKKKTQFVKHDLSRCVAAMIPEVARLEYHLHGQDEVVIIRLRSGDLRRVDVTGLDLRQTTQAVLVRLGDCA